MKNNLSKKVLLLNGSYEPLSVINGKKAIIMLITNKVDYIEKSEIYIHSEKLKISTFYKFYLGLGKILYFAPPARLKFKPKFSNIFFSKSD